MYNNLQKHKSQLFFITKLIIITGAFYIISLKIIENKILYTSDFYSFIKSNILYNYLNLFLLILFTVANWFFEIIKWKTLVSSFKKITFNDASKQSLASLTASLLTPNRIGEYGVKAIYYPKENRKKVLILNFLGNVSQMLMTIVFGLIGLLYLTGFFNFKINISKLTIVIIISSVILLVLLFFKLKFLKKWIKKFINNILSIPAKIQLSNLGFSFIRYLIFSHQFYFLLIIFNVDLDYYTALSLITSTYFIASFIPGFVVFDFIIKGSVAVSLFGLLQVNEIVILTITTIMWLLNFALPSIFGSYFVLIFKKLHPIKIPIHKK
ncbi:MAG: lysylphosphatidylglycerol synthase domain-containing protein [Bacteroidota bacterium]